MIDTNAMGPYLTAKAAVPQMLAAGWGPITGVSKHPDQMHEAHTGAYAPSKACLEAQSLSWAEELLGTGVTVNILEPGGALRARGPRQAPV